MYLSLGFLMYSLLQDFSLSLSGGLFLLLVCVTDILWLSFTEFIELRIHTYLTILSDVSLGWFQSWMYVMRSDFHLLDYCISEPTVLHCILFLFRRFYIWFHIIQYFDHFVIRLSVLCLYTFWSWLFVFCLDFPLPEGNSVLDLRVFLNPQPSLKKKI